MPGLRRVSQVWRTPPGEELFSMLRPDFSQLSDMFRAATSFALGVHPERPPLPLLASLMHAAQCNGGMLSVAAVHAACGPACCFNFCVSCCQAT